MAETQKLAELDGVEIAYYDLDPTGIAQDTILLIHGFASNASVNWLGTGWAKVLQDEGHRVIALDNRGHGNSTKFYTPEDYGPHLFAADAFKLLDHLGIEQCHVMGYSMGARITSWMAYEHPERLKSAVFGGMGVHIFGQRGGYEVIAEGLETDDPATITDKGAMAFRRFADVTGSDRMALAACVRPSEVLITPEIISSINVPTLVAVGGDDEIGGSAIELAKMMPNAQGVVLEGLDHMKATGAPAYKKAVLEFLKRVNQA